MRKHTVTLRMNSRKDYAPTLQVSSIDHLTSARFKHGDYVEMDFIISGDERIRVGGNVGGTSGLQIYLNNNWDDRIGKPGRFINSKRVIEPGDRHHATIDANTIEITSKSKATPAREGVHRVTLESKTPISVR